jgi:ABC-type enterochelin transport system substrate-binding protein
MKTLTAIAMAGAVALSGCKYNASHADAEHVYSTERHGYQITVTDQETHRLNLMPRRVVITATENNMTPFQVIGDMENAFAPKPTFAHGYIRHTLADAKGCWWGPAERAPCSAADVKTAQLMLTGYAAFTTDK